MTKKGYRKVPDQDTEDQHELHHPLITANFLSILTFWWMNGIFRKGNKRPLNQSDFLPLHHQDRTRDLTERLQKQWNSDLQKCNEDGTEPKLWKSVMKMIPFKEFCVSWLLILLESVAQVMQPLLIGIFVHFLRSGNADPVYLYLCAGLMTLNGFLYLFSNISYFHLELLGMKLRSALQGLVYLKVGATIILNSFFFLLRLQTWTCSGCLCTRCRLGYASISSAVMRSTDVLQVLSLFFR